jgi:hypothetical protein
VRGAQNTGTGFLSEKLSAHLINEIMKALPSIQSYIEGTIAKLSKELTALGGDVSHSRGAMLHMTLQLCHKMERAFERIVDGGKDGAWSAAQHPRPFRKAGTALISCGAACTR